MNNSDMTTGKKILSIAMGNVVAFALHVAISLVYFIIVVVSIIVFEHINQGADVANAVIVVAGFLLAAAGYLFFGLKRTNLGTVGNLLSVATLPIFLGLVPLIVGFFQLSLDVGIWFSGHFDSAAAHSMAAMINAPAVFTLSIPYGLIANPDPYISGEPPIIFITAAFIPSLLMFAGFYLRTWRESRQEVMNEGVYE